jgi:hypothetical protein
VSRQIVATKDAFNRHGAFTARVIEDIFHRDAVEVRHLDTGEIAATVWAPTPNTVFDQWRWLLGGGRPNRSRNLPSAAGIDELVRAVATSVLDEGPKR